MVSYINDSVIERVEEDREEDEEGVIVSPLGVDAPSGFFHPWDAEAAHPLVAPPRWGVALSDNHRQVRAVSGLAKQREL